MLKTSTDVLFEAKKLVIRYRISKGLRNADAFHLASWNLYSSFLSESQRGKLYFITADRKQFSAFTAEGHVGELVL